MEPVTGDQAVLLGNEPQSSHAQGHVQGEEGSQEPGAGAEVKIENAEKERVSVDDVQQIQGMIERCLHLYMSKQEVVSVLHSQVGVDPSLSNLVWQKLETQNKDFFRQYNLRLRVKEQITAFNFLVGQQAQLQERAALQHAQASSELQKEANVDDGRQYDGRMDQSMLADHFNLSPFTGLGSPNFGAVQNIFTGSALLSPTGHALHAGRGLFPTGAHSPNPFRTDSFLNPSPAVGANRASSRRPSAGEVCPAMGAEGKPEAGTGSAEP